MNLLLIHNNYGAYSGEESVVDKQIVLFEGLGHHVSVFRKTTEGKRGTLAGNLKGLLQGFYSPASVRDIRQLIKQNKPDAVIIHNLYPYISPAILQPIKEAGIPIIMTIHNFRLICPTGLFMRNSEPCELCLEKGNEWSCIQYNCEQSLLKSIGYAGRNWYARITKAYKNNVDYFACITQFQTKKLIQAGYDQDKMRVIPNFVEQISDPNFTPGEYVAFSGRMSKEKGIDLVLEAARKTPNIPFVFAGTPRPEDACLLQDIPSNCTFTGHLSGKELADFYRNARFLVMASRWYEGFPMTILDASSYGKPTIGPTIGGLPEIIDNGRTGLLFTPGSSDELKDRITTLWNDPEKSIQMGKAAFIKLKENYSTNKIQEKWNELFKLIE